MVNTPVFDPKVVEKLADEKTAAKMEELKQNLIQGISGKKQEWLDGSPKDWNHVEQGVETVAQREAQKVKAEIRSELEAERKAAQDRTLQEEASRRTQTQAQVNAEWRQMTEQWKEAVADGLLPEIKPEVSKVLADWQSGKKDAQGNPIIPTPEQMNDPGVKAYAEAKALHEKLKAEGKSSNFYRTVEKFYNKKPAGAHAPVLGASRSVGTSKGYSYKEVHKGAMSLLRHR